MDTFFRTQTLLLLFIALCVVMTQAVASEAPKDAMPKVLRLIDFEVLRGNSANDVTGHWAAVKLPDSWREHQQTPFRYSWYRSVLDESNGVVDLQTPFAVYIPRVSMNVSVMVNGREIGNGGRFSEPISRNHGRPLLFFVPALAEDRRGPVVLTMQVSDNSWAFGYLGPVYVGAPNLLSAMYRQRNFWQVQLTTALALLMLIFSLASFALFVRRRKETHYFWFGAAMFLFAVDTFNVFVTDIPVGRKTWEIYSQEVIFAFAVAVIIFIHRFTQQGWKRAEPLLAVLLLVKPVMLLMVDVNWFFATSSAFNIVVIGYGLALAVLVVNSYMKTARFETGITALSGMILLAVAFLSGLFLVGAWHKMNT